MSLTLLLPIKTLSEANLKPQTRIGLILKSKRIKDQRIYTFYNLIDAWNRPPALPFMITLTRIAPRALDAEDNLPASLKFIRDGVADWIAGTYGKGDDRQQGLTWRYAQQRGKPREYAVLITLETNDDVSEARG